MNAHDPHHQVQHDDDRQQVWVVIPAFNESDVLNAVVGTVRALGYNVVVVDDGSAAPIERYLDARGTHLLRHPVNLGQGAALQTGIEYALQRGATYLVTFDADGQHRAAEIERLLAPLRLGRAEIVLGSRFLPGGGAPNIPPKKRFVLRLATLLARLTLRLALTDTHNGFRALSADAARRIHLTQNRMAHASQILQEIARLKLRYCEVPVTIDYSQYALAKGQRLSNAFNILWDSLAEALHR